MKEYQYKWEKNFYITKIGGMVFNCIFNNISAISWRLVLLVEVTGVPDGNHRPAANLWQILSPNIVSSTPRLSWIQTHNVSGNMHWLPYYRYVYELKSLEYMYKPVR